MTFLAGVAVGLVVGACLGLLACGLCVFAYGHQAPEDETGWPVPPGAPS